MQQGQDTILSRLGKALRALVDEPVNEPLPTRWVELIRYLDEQERRPKDSREGETSARGRQGGGGSGIG
jgi:hypothetical protein